MKTVTLGVSSRAASKRRLAGALAGQAQGEFIAFASVELLWKVLTAKRWEILRALTGQDELSIRERARRLGSGRGGRVLPLRRGACGVPLDRRLTQPPTKCISQ